MHTDGCVSKHLGVAGRQIRQPNLRCDGEPTSGEVSDSTLPRKVSMEEASARTANRHR